MTYAEFCYLIQVLATADDNLVTVRMQIQTGAHNSAPSTSRIVIALAVHIICLDDDRPLWLPHIAMHARDDPQALKRLIRQGQMGGIGTAHTEVSNAVPPNA